MVLNDINTLISLPNFRVSADYKRIYQTKNSEESAYLDEVSKGFGGSSGRSEDIINSGEL